MNVSGFGFYLANDSQFLSELAQLGYTIRGEDKERSKYEIRRNETPVVKIEESEGDADFEEQPTTTVMFLGTARSDIHELITRFQTKYSETENAQEVELWV